MLNTIYSDIFDGRASAPVRASATTFTLEAGVTQGMVADAAGKTRSSAKHAHLCAHVHICGAHLQPSRSPKHPLTSISSSQALTALLSP